MNLGKKLVIFVADDSAAPGYVFDDLRKTSQLTFIQVTGEDPKEGWPETVVGNLVKSSEADQVIVDEFLLDRGILSHSASVRLVKRIASSFPGVVVTGWCSSFLTEQLFRGVNIPTIRKTNESADLIRQLAST